VIRDHLVVKSNRSNFRASESWQRACQLPLVVRTVALAPGRRGQGPFGGYPHLVAVMRLVEADDLPAIQSDCIDEDFDLIGFRASKSRTEYLYPVFPLCVFRHSHNP
jgi:hypothetical protein